MTRYGGSSSASVSHSACRDARMSVKDPGSARNASSSLSSTWNTCIGSTTWPRSCIRRPSSRKASLGSCISMTVAFLPASRRRYDDCPDAMPAASSPAVASSPATAAVSSATAASRRRADSAARTVGDFASSWRRTRSIIWYASVGLISQVSALISHSLTPRWPKAARRSSRPAVNSAASGTDASRSPRPSTPASNAAVSAAESRTSRDRSQTRSGIPAEATSPRAPKIWIASSGLPTASAMPWTICGPTVAPMTTWA